eukprot:12214738-Alexandrium_andersonii.AAC.1
MRVPISSVLVVAAMRANLRPCGANARGDRVVPSKPDRSENAHRLPDLRVLHVAVGVLGADLRCAVLHLAAALTGLLLYVLHVLAGGVVEPVDAPEHGRRTLCEDGERAEHGVQHCGHHLHRDAIAEGGLHVGLRERVEAGGLDATAAGLLAPAQVAAVLPERRLPLLGGEDPQQVVVGPKRGDPVHGDGVVALQVVRAADICDPNGYLALAHLREVRQVAVQVDLLVLGEAVVVAVVARLGVQEVSELRGGALFDGLQQEPALRVGLAQGEVGADDEYARAVVREPVTICGGADDVDAPHLAELQLHLADEPHEEALGLAPLLLLDAVDILDGPEEQR